MPVATLWEHGDIDETVIRGVLAAPASTVQQFEKWLGTSPENRIWLMLMLINYLAALPLSHEEYVARTRGELEQIVRYLRGLHVHELGRDNISMNTIVHKYEEIHM